MLHCIKTDADIPMNPRFGFMVVVSSLYGHSSRSSDTNIAFSMLSQANTDFRYCKAGIFLYSHIRCSSLLFLLRSHCTARRNGREKGLLTGFI
jgi:hypothetical protein